MAMKLFLTAAFAVSFAAVPAFTAFAANGVAVNKTNFPDKAFREYVLANFDGDKDNSLSASEISAVTSINLKDKGVEDMKGIEYFTSLTSLNCSYNAYIRELDVSKNTSLKTLICSNTNIDELDLAKNTALQKLDCAYTIIGQLDLKKNTNLTYLDCEHTRLQELDLSKNTKLKYLDYSDNCGMLDTYGFYHLKPDLSKNTLLEELHFDKISSGYNDNEQFTIDLTNNKKIKVLTCYDSCVANLKISGLTNLTKLDCGSNKLTALNLTEFTKLTHLDVSYNRLTVLNIAKNTALTELYCQSNELKTLDLTNNKSLKKVSCEDNQLTSLKLTGLSLLEFLECDDNKLSSLDLSTNSALTELDCSYNNIKSLDLSNHTKLKRLETGRNSALTTLKVTGDTALDYLGCRECKITSLNISNLTKLTRVDCAFNAITTLNASGCKILNLLWCSNNKITNLTLSGCKALVSLDARNNSFTSININDCPWLLKAYWSRKTEEIGEEDGINYHYFQYSWSGDFGTDDYGKSSSFMIDYKVKLKSPPPSPTPTPSPKPTATPTPKVVAKCTLSRPSVLVCGKTGQAKVTFDPAAKSVKWQSSDPDTAAIDGNGKITAKKAGTVTITITTNDNRNVKFVLPVLYKDVTDSSVFWYEPTNYLTAKGYDKQTKFKPANDCTRAQMVTFIWRLEGSPEPKAKTCKFTDVSKTDYFYKACIWGNENHIVEGYNDGTFGPQIICARKHAVTFLWRLAGSHDPFHANQYQFSDVKPTDYYYKATIWAAENKILAGYDDGTFRPDGSCLRRQMVTFLYKYDKYINGKG